MYATPICKQSCKGQAMERACIILYIYTVIKLGYKITWVWNLFIYWGICITKYNMLVINPLRKPLCQQVFSTLKRIIICANINLNLNILGSFVCHTLRCHIYSYSCLHLGVCMCVCGMCESVCFLHPLHVTNTSIASKPQATAVVSITFTNTRI